MRVEIMFKSGSTIDMDLEPDEGVSEKDGWNSLRRMWHDLETLHTERVWIRMSEVVYIRPLHGE